MSGIIGTSHSKSKIIGRSQDTAKAWVSYNGSTNSINESFGVSSVTDVNTGNYDVVFESPFQNDDYAVSTEIGPREDAYIVHCCTGDRSATQVTVWSRYYVNESSMGNYDFYSTDVIVFGD